MASAVNNSSTDTTLRYPSLTAFDPLTCLRLIRTEHVGPVTFFQLLSRYGSPEDALKALPTLTLRGNRGKAPAPCTEEAAQQELDWYTKHNITLISYGDTTYPTALTHLYDPPPLLIAKGNLSLLQRTPIIGMVGGRNASANGRQFARKLAIDLGTEGCVIASGLARGIDTAAHLGSLDSGTIAVTACGIDVAYPPENASLQQQIAERGLLLTEQPLGTTPNARNFPRRNRIISGISAGVVVVEASLKSGSLITARMATEQGREVFAVPGSPLDTRCLGSNDLLRQGAVLTESATDVLRELSPVTPLLFSETGQVDFFAAVESDETGEETLVSADDAHTLITSFLGPAPVLVDELVTECQLTPQQVAMVLLDLELSGHIERHPGGRVSRIMEAA